MTTYLITEAQRQQCIDSHLNNAVAILQSLPMVEDGQPVAYRYSFSCGEVWTLSSLDPGKAIRSEALVDPLYKSPQALTLITADDVTDEMIDAYIADISQHNLIDVKIAVAAAYNAVIKHRSEAR